jgi:hypothetical protein
LEEDHYVYYEKQGEKRKAYRIFMRKPLVKVNLRYEIGDGRTLINQRAIC